MISKYIRSLIFNIVFFLLTSILTLMAFFGGFFTPRIIYWVAATWGRSLIIAMDWILGIKTTIRGLENVPKDRPYIFACKHQSAFDTALIQILAPTAAVILKKELRYVPIFGQVLMMAKSICLDRRKGKHVIPQLIKGAQERIAEGRPIFIYPEGTRGPAGQRGRYKHGIVAMYEALNVPVVPAALNTGYFWPRRGFLKYPGEIVIDVLPPIAAGLEPQVFLETLTNNIENACEKLPKRMES